jgi:hypothetical protein
VLQIGSCEPYLDALAYVLNGVGEDDLGVVVILES